MRFSTPPATALIICLSSIASLATASAQMLPPKDRFPEALEKYEMQPALPGTYRLESSPQLIPQLGPFDRYRDNVDGQGNNIVGGPAHWPWISVAPTNAKNITISW